MSYLSLCPAFPFRYTLLFFHPGSYSSPQGGETGGMHTSHPQADIEPLQWIIGSLLFVRNEQFMKGDFPYKSLQGLLKSLRWLKLWFPTGIYYHVLLLVSDVTRVASSVSVSAKREHCRSAGKVVRRVFRTNKQHLCRKKKKVQFSSTFIALLTPPPNTPSSPTEPPEPLCGLENVTMATVGKEGRRGTEGVKCQFSGNCLFYVMR